MTSPVAPPTPVPSDGRPATVRVRDLAKHYEVHEKEPGLMGSLRSFVNRRTRTVQAVKGVSFELREGDMVGFLGPNGAGKTTTLKMLAGLLHPTSGEIDVLGHRPQRRAAAYLKQITLVMGQKQQLLWDLPALDSFLVNKEIYEIDDADFRATMAEFDDVLNLSPILKKQVRKLSLGERMKCELAAALLHKPRILFLDEPTIGLDVNMQQNVRDFVKAYNERYRATVILTSHYMADVTALCERILVIDAGELRFDGDLARLVDASSGEKTVRLQLARPVPAADLARFGTLVSNEGLSAELRVPRPEVAPRAARLLSELPVLDLTVEDPPIEAVIGSLFGGRG